MTEADHAARIIQRFWFAQARWNTTKRLTQKLRRMCVEYRVYDRYEFDKFLLTAFSPEARKIFYLWTTRINQRNIGESLPSYTEDQVGSIQTAYIFSMYPLSTVMDVSSALSISAARVATSLTMVMNEIRNPVSMSMRECMDEYLTCYNTWRCTNKERLQLHLVEELLPYVHDAVSQRNREAELDRKDSLVQKYSALLGVPLNVIRAKAFASREIKVMYTLHASEFWGPGSLSLFRMMHEVLMDENFDLRFDDSFPSLETKYTPIPTSHLKITHLLADVRSVVMWPPASSSMLRRMAFAFDLENEEWPENVWRIASRAIPIICDAIPNFEAAALCRIQWQDILATSTDTSHVLKHLIFCARLLRYEQGCLDLDVCRRNIRRNELGFDHTFASSAISKATRTKRTEEWILQTLLTYPENELRRIADGDPYSLLGLHDQSIVRFALQGDLSEAHPPEMLVFDMERFKHIRTNMQLITCSDPCARLEALVNLNCTDGNAQAELNEAASILRRVIFISRFQHGDTFARLARQVAERLQR